MNYTTYIFLGDNCNDKMRNARKFALDKGLAVFGWGWCKTQDLNNDDCYSNDYYGKFKRLKDIKVGDKIVYVHFNKDKSIEESHYGDCTIMTVVGEYEFNNEMTQEYEDFGHTIKIAPHSVYSFNRNSKSIHPIFSKALKPRKAMQRFWDNEKLKISLENHKNGIEPDYFENEMTEGLSHLVNTIQANHHDKALELFLKPLFEKIYSNKYDNVSVKVNGSGWKTDHGADLIIKYTENFDNLDIDIESKKVYTVVVQAKSYKWTLNDDNAIRQCKQAIEKYNAEYAILVTTACIDDIFQDKISSYNQSENEKGSISVVDGEQLAKLYIKNMM